MRLASPAALLLLSTAIEASNTVYSTQTISLSSRRRDQNSHQLKIRGGASTAAALSEDEYDDEEYDEEYDEYDEEEEEEELDAKLSRATEAALEKARKKKADESKKAMEAAKKKTAAKKKRKSVLKLLRMPYIVRAMLNPFTVIAMTRKYFASLFNVNYLEDNTDSSAGLRSALEQKARQAGSNKPKPRGKRQMRPGQAKTLSDLPQLSA